MSKTPVAQPAQEAAVIDLGTNTFHLLIGRFDAQGKLHTSLRERRYVRLLREQADAISPPAAERAREVCRFMGQLLGQRELRAVRAYGTAAFRTAANGPALRAELSELLGTQIEIIDGDREAQLIARGVLAGGLPRPGGSLIMDIGGGSVEYILLDEAGQALASKSLPVGAQVLRSAFHLEEPFSTGQQEAALFAHLDRLVQPLFDELHSICEQRQLRMAAVLGASGTFDVLAQWSGAGPEEVLTRIDAGLVRTLYTESLLMTEQQRLADPRIPDERADLLVVALALVVWTLDRMTLDSGKAPELWRTAYALKEGALAESTID